MKALVILNNYKKFDGFIRDIVSDSFLNEAIKELEELESRSCENCKYWKTSQLDGNSICKKLFNFRSYFDFCCNKWEPK